MVCEYVIERYTNKEQTKTQVICIPYYKDDKKRTDRECAFLRFSIDPELTYLYSRSYTDEHLKKLLTVYYNKYGDIIKRETPYRYPSKYSKYLHFNGVNIADAFKLGIMSSRKLDKDLINKKINKLE